MWSDTPWRAQKVAALTHVVDYDDRIAPGYGLIPAWDYTAAQHQPDQVQQNVFADADKHAPNTPYDSQGLYLPHQNLQGGFVTYSPADVAIDFAPFLLKDKIWANQQLRPSMMINRQPLGEDLPNGTARGVRTNIPLLEVTFRNTYPPPMLPANPAIASYK